MLVKISEFKVPRFFIKGNYYHSMQFELNVEVETESDSELEPLFRPSSQIIESVAPLTYTPLLPLGLEITYERKLYFYPACKYEDSVFGYHSPTKSISEYSRFGSIPYSSNFDLYLLPVCDKLDVNEPYLIKTIAMLENLKVVTLNMNERHNHLFTKEARSSNEYMDKSLSYTNFKLTGT